MVMRSVIVEQYSCVQQAGECIIYIRLSLAIANAAFQSNIKDIDLHRDYKTASAIVV